MSLAGFESHVQSPGKRKFSAYSAVVPKHTNLAAITQGIAQKGSVLICGAAFTPLQRGFANRY
jgi:hypothetical protein